MLGFGSVLGLRPLRAGAHVFPLSARQSTCAQRPALRLVRPGPARRSVEIGPRGLATSFAILRNGLASFSAARERLTARPAPRGARLLRSSAVRARARDEDEGGEDDDEGHARLRRIKLAPASLESASSFELDAEQRVYLVKALRLAPGDLVEGFDGRGRSRPFALAADDRRLKRVSLVPAGEIAKHADERPAGVPRVVLWLPLLRKDRLEWAVEKLAETGLDALQFYRADRSRPGRVDFDRLRRIRDEAERQSVRHIELELRDEEARGLAALRGPSALWFDPGAERSLADAAAALRGADEVALVVGPEGGFSEGERAALRAAAGGAARLDGCGHVLKADTAALAALLLFRSHFP